jgi:hypothetical protein
MPAMVTIASYSLSLQERIRRLERDQNLWSRFRKSIIKLRRRFYGKRGSAE